MHSAMMYALIPVVLVCIRRYRVYKWGRCKDFYSLEGKVFIVTGANSGIGKATVRELVRRKARVIMACRDLEKAKEAIQDIRRREMYGELIPMHLDLTSLESVREFAAEVQRHFHKIDVLINNAGVYFPLSEDKKTDDGFEIHFGVNYLAHYLLSRLLLKNLKNGRIVNVASSLYERGIDNFNVDAVPPGYASSKLANILFSLELARRTSNMKIDVYSVCPGFTYTGLFRNRSLRWYTYIFLAPVAFFYMRTAIQGAQTVLHCALSKKLKGRSGCIYKDCQEYKSKKAIKPEWPCKLWFMSEKLVGLPSHSKIDEAI